MRHKITPLFVILALYISTISLPAYAYLDPGTGSMILQIVVAGVLGALFTIKTWWANISLYLKRTFSSGK